MCAGLKAAQAFEGWTIIVAHGKACVDFHVAIHTGPVSAYRNAGEVGPEGLAANPPGHGEVDTVAVTVVLGLLTPHTRPVQPNLFYCLATTPRGY